MLSKSAVDHLRLAQFPRVSDLPAGIYDATCVEWCERTDKDRVGRPCLVFTARFALTFAPEAPILQFSQRADTTEGAKTEYYAGREYVIHVTRKPGRFSLVRLVLVPEVSL